MRFLELLKFSVMSLLRRKMRSFLTVLGVIIGTASIVVMVSVGLGLGRQVTDMYASSSTLTLITVSQGYGSMDLYGTSHTGADAVTLTRETINSFSQYEHVKVVSPLYNYTVNANCGKLTSSIQVTAVSHEMLMALNLPVIEGALPEKGMPLTYIAGRQLGYWFTDPAAYDYPDPTAPPPVNMVQDTVFVTYDSYTSGTDDTEYAKKYLMQTSAIIGFNSSEENMGGYSDFDYMLYADLDAVEEFFQMTYKRNIWPGQIPDSNGKAVFPIVYSQAFVIVDDLNNVSQVQQKINDLGFTTYSSMEIIEVAKQTNLMIQYALGGIGSISLLVASIGITNTMIMSIMERTKEIGIFKVLGCSLPNIRSMFLCEAGLIGLVGGVLGLVFSFILSFLINVFFDNVSYIAPWLALLGIGVAISVGLIAGISPAARAMKLSPLEAIRSL